VNSKYKPGELVAPTKAEINEYAGRGEFLIAKLYIFGALCPVLASGIECAPVEVRPPRGWHFNCLHDSTHPMHGTHSAMCNSLALAAATVNNFFGLSPDEVAG